MVASRRSEASTGAKTIVIAPCWTALACPPRMILPYDWSQVVALYDQLVRIDASPVVALNRAIAVAEFDGPEVALATVERLERRLAGYHAYHATRADLLRRLGHSPLTRWRGS